MSLEDKKGFKMRSWEPDDTQYNLFKAMCSKEGVKVGEKINELIEKENKEHGDGNPSFHITDFVDENFLAPPAFMRDGQSVRNYLEKIYGTPEWDKIGTQLQGVWINLFNDVEASHL